MWKSWAVPRFCELYPGIRLITEEKARKNLSKGSQRILPERLTRLRRVKKYPAFYGTRRFITSLTSSRDLYLIWARSVQFVPPHPTLWRSIFISSHLCPGLPIGLCPSSPHQYPLCTCPVSRTCYMPWLSYSRFHHPNSVWYAFSNAVLYNEERYRDVVEL